MDSAEICPLVTVVMPVRNAGAPLLAAVASIRMQTYPHWELVLIDDGSDDGFVDQVEKLGDERIHVMHADHSLGIAVRLNQGVALARGSLLARMDADDVSFPQRLERQVQALLADEGIDLIGASTITIDEQSQLVGMFPRALAHAQLCRRPWQGFHLVHPSWMGRTAWFRENPYAEPAPYRCEDQELLLRTHGHSRFACTPEVLLAYRLRDHVDVAQLARTRKSWWQCQRRQFWQGGNWISLLLAWCCYRLRLLKDLAMRCTGGRIVRSEVARVPADVARQWRSLRTSLPSGN